MNETTSARAVSAALADARTNDLLEAVTAVEQQWRAELDVASTRARALHAAVLEERHALKRALGTAARIWSVWTKPEEEEHPEYRNALALRNATHTLQLLEFFERIPAALGTARTFLKRVVDDGARNPRQGNAAKIYEVHALLSALDRLQDLMVLEFIDDKDETPPTLPTVIREAKAVRSDFDTFIINSVFGDILDVAKVNPRLLVTAMRVIMAEEQRDQWYNSYAESLQLYTENSIPSRKQLEYRQRFFDAVARQVDEKFESMRNDLQTEIQPRQQGASEVSRVLLWLDDRVADRDLVDRYVAPCVPPEFDIVQFYSRNLHEAMMKTLTNLLRSTAALQVGEQDAVLRILSWYSTFKSSVQNVDLDNYLDDGDRVRLVEFMREHVAQTVGTRIEDLVNVSETANTTKTAVPPVLFTSIDNLVRYASTLDIPAVRKSIAIAISEALRSLQSRFELVLAVGEAPPLSATRPRFVCSIANSMADLLEYVEALRDSLGHALDEVDRTEVGSCLEHCAVRFKQLAVSAINDLTRHVESSVASLLAKLFAPNTGTEIMLDIIGTMEDSLRALREDLIKEHYDHLVLECLRCVVAHYVVPFLSLAQSSWDPGRIAATRSEYTPRLQFDSLKGSFRANSRKSLDRVESKHRKTRRVQPTGQGLLMMNATAVIAQIDKDEENLNQVLIARAQPGQKRLMTQVTDPLSRLRAMYTCAPTPTDLVRAYQEARAAVATVMQALGTGCGPQRKSLTVRAAESIWGARADVNAAVREEAVMYANMGGLQKDKLAADLYEHGRSSREWRIGSRMSESSEGLVWSPTVLSANSQSAH